VELRAAGATYPGRPSAAPAAGMVDTILGELSPQFDQLYSKVGRPSIPPEHLLRALLLQVLYSVRSERLLMEQLDYNLLFRWFVAWPWMTRSGTPRCSPKNRERLLRRRHRAGLFRARPRPGRATWPAVRRALHGRRHLDRRLASLKSFQRKDAPPTAPDDPGNPTVNFHGERRRNATHASTTDPQALLYARGPGGKPSSATRGTC